MTPQANLPREVQLGLELYWQLLMNWKITLTAAWLGAAWLAPPARTETRTPELQGWNKTAKVRPLAPRQDRHSIHSYFNTSPESPDGRWVVYYTSNAPDGHVGEVRILQRATGEEKILARNVTVEDAHRSACQQWISNSRRVVFHDFRDGHWLVLSVDVDTLAERVLARDRMVSWGQPRGNLVPIYGPHYDPNAFRDLELLDVESGQRRLILKAGDVRKAYPDLVASVYGDRQFSIYFPVLSPDSDRVFFKLAAPDGGDFRSKKASTRELLFVYGIGEQRLLFGHEKWGHPAWHPDSRRILNVGPVVIDSIAGTLAKVPGLPPFPGAHPSYSPDGQLFATDTKVDVEGHWGVVVGSVKGNHHQVIHTFDNSKGASSWRVSHPHPVFSADGRRLYFNVNATRWTQLYVAERAD